MVKIAVDAMGGDNAPGEIVAGAVMAAQSREDIQIFLIGKEEVVSEELKKHTYKKEQIEVVNATEVIETEEPPVNAFRQPRSLRRESRRSMRSARRKIRPSWSA